MFLSEWRELPSAPCLAGKKKNLMTDRVSMLLKSHASLTCFLACFLPGRAKDLSASRYSSHVKPMALNQFLVRLPLKLQLLIFFNYWAVRRKRRT